MQLSVFTPSFTVAGMSSKGSGAATVQQNGLVRIPQSSLAFVAGAGAGQLAGRTGSDLDESFDRADDADCGHRSSSRDE